jgi:hypothetical protein
VGTMLHVELLALTLFICLLTYVMETRLVLPLLNELEVDYEKIENIPLQCRDALITDLKLRTGLDIKQVEVLSIDFLRDSARLRLHFYPLSTASLNPESVPKTVCAHK